MSADALAKEVGYSTQSGISNLENRAVGRGGFKLPEIARALDFSLEWFLNGPDVEDLSQVSPFGQPYVIPNQVEEPQGKYLTSRQRAHQLVDQLSDLGIEKAIAMLELAVAAHPRTSENGAGVLLPASLKSSNSRR